MVSAIRPASPGLECPGVLVVGGAHSALAAIRSLGAHCVPVRFLGHDHPIPRLSRFLLDRHTYGGPLSPAALDEIEALCQRERLEGWLLLPCADAEALLFAEHSVRLSKVFKLLSPPAETLRLLNEKSALYRHAEGLGLPVPRIIACNPKSFAESVFPVAIKPSTRRRVNAFTSAKAWRADTAEQLSALYEKAVTMAGDDGVVVQQLVPGGGKSQWSYAALWNHGEPVLSLTAMRLRQYPIEFGATSTFVQTVENQEVAGLAEILLRSVNYHGVVEVEFKHDVRDGRYKLLDVNTRPWTWTALGAKAGTDFCFGAWQLANGEKVPRAEAKPGYAWTHLSRDVAAAAALMLAGQITAVDYLGSFGQSLCFAAMQLNDPLPGILDMPVLMPRLLARLRLQRSAPSSGEMAAQ